MRERTSAVQSSYRSPEARWKMAEAARKAWRNPEHRAAVCAALRARFATPESKARRSAASLRGEQTKREAREQCVDRQFAAALARFRAARLRQRS